MRCTKRPSRCKFNTYSILAALNLLNTNHITQFQEGLLPEGMSVPKGEVISQVSWSTPFRHHVWTLRHTIAGWDSVIQSRQSLWKESGHRYTGGHRHNSNVWLLCWLLLNPSMPALLGQKPSCWE